VETILAKSNAKKNQKARAVGIGAGPIVEDEFGNYKIRAGQLNGEFVARAFPRHSARSQGLMAEAKGASEGDAIEALKAMLTERETERTAARRWEARSDVAVPTPEEYLEALRQTTLSAAQLAMLKALAVAGEEGLGLPAVMTAGGYKSQDAAMKALTKAANLMADFIGIAPAPAGKDGLDSVCFRQAEGADAPQLLILHAELRDAVWQTI